MLHLLFLAFVCVGQWQSWLMTTPLQGSTRRVTLADAYGFGVCKDRATIARKLAYRHINEFRELVAANNSESSYQTWRVESRWRYRCWDLLEDALNEFHTPSFRLAALEELIESLGEEDYCARRMPSPTPSYRVAER